MLAGFVLGLCVGGCAVALGIWVVSGLVAARPDPLAIGVVVAVAVAATAREAGIVRFPLPQNRRQVPQSVFYMGDTGSGSSSSASRRWARAS